MLALSLLVIFSLLEHPPAQSATAISQWDFRHGSLDPSFGPGTIRPLGATSTTLAFGTSSEFSLPDIEGEAVEVLKFPSATSREVGFRAHPSALANAGGNAVNDFSLVFDLLIPKTSFASDTWLPLFSTDASNSNDADAFVRLGDGGIGINGQYHGALQADTWHRIALVFASSQAGELRLYKYIDGHLVGLQAAGSIDGRFSIFARDSDTPWFHLFADENGEGSTGFVSSILFADRTLSDSVIRLLGRPKATGVLDAEGVIPEVANAFLPALHNGIYTPPPPEISSAPYVQNVTHDRATIMWETIDGENSWVEWGSSSALGQKSEATSLATVRQAKIHSSHLDGLEPGTRYFYQATTDGVSSQISSFITADEDPEQPLRIALFSDSQRDGSRPTEFKNLIEEGLIRWSKEQTGAPLDESISFALLPGDLVQNGNSYEQWRDHFLGPAHSLMAQVPLYPVPGNHENDSHWFFAFFELPENGSPGFEEHWWWMDRSNVRVIGLDSNGPYRIDEQLSWLDTVLLDACNTDHIDFVFAQLHHPHLSELWLAGETPFTGQIIEKLESFSSTCSKPSAHFFGHTHGYSRGQSRDHQHLWVNVATAGGAIDNWGEFGNRDYDEFSVTQDEYGFVILDVEAGENPRFHLRRIGRGDQSLPADNVLRDEILIRRDNTPPEQPRPIAPIEADLPSGDILLEASSFVDADSDPQGASHWQVAASCSGFDLPIDEQWHQHENWYEDIDKQAGDNLADALFEELGAGDYCWRVRYRDRSLAWSDWSEGAGFRVIAVQD